MRRIPGLPEPGDPRTWVPAAYAVVEQINGGNYGPRTPLPRAADLAARCGVSFIAAVKAYLFLSDLGIVHSVPGHGTYAGPRTTGSHRGGCGPRCAQGHHCLCDDCHGVN